MPRLLGRSWLDAFLEYTDDMESPKEWLLWSGISTLSSVIKRNCYIPWRKIRLYPNQYIVFVGPPGIGKGEAMRVGQSLVEPDNLINYIKDWHTPQQIIDELSVGFQSLHMQIKVGQIITTTPNTDHTACIFAEELAVLLQNYDNMTTIMCTWWDKGEFEYKTKHKGQHTIKDLSVSLLAACVPDYLRSLTKDRMGAITGGFTARTIFVYATKKDKLNKDSFGLPPPIMTKMKSELMNDLKHISTLQGAVTLDQEAFKYWDKIYDEHNQRGIIDSDASQNFKARISAHVLKTATAISLSESDNLKITRTQLERASRIVERVRDQVDIVFRCVGESQLSGASAKILAYIEQAGFVTYYQLLKVMYRDVTEDQFTGIMSVLVKVGAIRETQTPTGKIAYESMNQVNMTQQGAGIP